MAAVWLTSMPLNFKFLDSKPGSDNPFLINRDWYDQEKLYVVKRFVYSTQTGENPPPAKMRTHAIRSYLASESMILEMKNTSDEKNVLTRLKIFRNPMRSDDLLAYNSMFWMPF